MADIGGVPHTLVVPGDVFNFIEVMAKIDMFQSVENVIEFLDKPWHWDVEYDLWVHYGKPRSEEDEGFDQFYTEIDKLVNA